MLRYLKLLSYTTVFTISAIVAISITSPVYAQSPAPSTPFYPLAPCPSCTVPSGTTVDPEEEQAPNEGQQEENLPEENQEEPNEGNQAPQIDDPCDEQTASLASHPKKKGWKHGNHRNNSGALSEGMEEIVQMLIELLNKLIELLGGQPIQTPREEQEEGQQTPQVPNENEEESGNGNENQPDPNQPDPCISPSTNQPNVPGNPPVQQPSTTVPGGVSQVPQPSGAAQPAPSQPAAVPSGGATITSCTQADIQKLVDSVSEAKLKEYLETLLDDPATSGKDEKRVRPAGSAGNQSATEYIQSVFAANGYQATLQPVPEAGSNVNNILGALPGSTPNTFYNLSAHMDTVSDAPGAEDDGSGTVVIMEAGRVLKPFQQCMKTGVELFATNDEESGMVGSAEYVQKLEGKTIKGNFNFDMVGNKGNTDCNSNFSKGSLGEELLNKYKEVDTKYNINSGGEFGTGGGSGIDAVNFWAAGIPSVSSDSCEFSPVYHSSGDTLQYISYTQLVKITKLVVAAVAELSMQ